MTDRTHRWSRSMVAIGALTAVAFVATACGSSKKASTTTASSAASASTTAAGGASTTAAGGGSTTAAAAKAPTGDPIVIGLVVAQTGQSASSYSPFTTNVTDAWVQWVNTEMGGIGGRPVKVVAADSAAQAAQAQTAVKTLVETNKAVAILVNDTTSETAIADYTSQNNIPVIGGSTNAAAIWLGKTNYFMLGATNPVSSAGGMIAAKANGATSIGLAYCAEVPACAQAQQLYGALAPQIPGGVTFAAGVPASATQPNYTAECLQLIDKKADWVQLGVSIGVGVKIANECQKQGYKGAFGASNQTLVAKPVETITPAVKFGGSITFFPWFAKSGPAKTFQDVMAKYAAGKDVGSVAATTMWTSLELFRKTMKTAPATSADVLKAYQGVTNETLDGLLPSPVSFSASKPSQPISCFWSVKWDGKAWSTITPTGDLAALATGNNGQTGDLASMCFTPKLG